MTTPLEQITKRIQHADKAIVLHIANLMQCTDDAQIIAHQSELQTLRSTAHALYNKRRAILNAMPRPSRCDMCNAEAKRLTRATTATDAVYCRDCIIEVGS